MAGHSKWSNIKHRKARQDKKRAKKFSKLVKEIIVEARKNPDPDDNPTLAGVIERARDADMPKENIERALKKAQGKLEGQNVQQMVYEGYGPSGVAVMVKAETDNRNRTSTDLKNIFDRYGGELGDEGCVRWIFNREGIVTVDLASLDEEDAEEIQLEAIEAGAEEIEEEDSALRLHCEPDDLQSVTEHMEGVSADVSSELVMAPHKYVNGDGDVRDEVQSLIDELEENQDIMSIFHNFKPLL
ncbi:MAG: YebC/PmpR family DNA-binding transcriptional regulator [Candidatus Bipolaricaulota bacterium]